MRDKVSGFLAEIAFAARRLWRAPVFTLAATLLLGAGMAVAAASASLVNVVLFKRPAAERSLVHLAIGHHTTSLPGHVVSTVLADPPASIAELAGFGTMRRAAAVAVGLSRPVTIEAVAGPYFALFNAVPLAGRLIHETDVRNGAMVAVISDRFWRATFDASPDAVGSTIAIAGTSLTIAGVVAPPNRSGRSPDVWVPSHLLPVDTLFGRLTAGTTIDQATAEVAARYGPFTNVDEMRTLVVREGLTPPLSERDYDVSAWYMAIGLAISLIASLSFGLLLFARMAATQSDMAVRLALGATSRDLTRLLACEVVLIAVGATFVATTAGGLLVPFVFGELRGGVAIPVDFTPDWRVFTFVGTITISVALAVVARLAWRVAEVAALGSMVATGGMGGATIRTADTSFRLVIAQSAATTALLLFAALLARAALPSRTFTHGLDVDRAAIAWIDETGRSDDFGQKQNRALLAAAGEIPGVRHAALISSLPGAYAPANVRLARAETWRPDVHYVSAAAFDAFGLVLRRGRAFTAREDEEGTAVAIVSETAARRFWPTLDPIGRRLEIARGAERPLEALVIGVVSDGEVESGSHDRGAEPRDVYLPITFRPRGKSVALLMRADHDAGVLADRLRLSLQQALPDVGFLSIQSLAQNLYERHAPPPYLTRIFWTLGLLVFAVAIGGLYALMSYLAAMRRREFGVRKALGATTATLCRMLVRESSRVLVPGALVGIAGGLLLGSFLVGHTTFRLVDPAAIVAVAGFIYVTGLACAIAPFVRTMLERNVALRES